ncbi:GTP-binding protein [Photobacterium sp. BZF1]|uniref:CobW family GTP-binding protein n=1 Tax=Photobacterium sp. BZF1 TaxID=1904457 RepID=UPI0016539DD7|nr:GTP-binding protein [Photobacterium sp. BZF1]MBC7006144.1 GTP-binding protein [Photobacterium sp. BZF1]
MSYRNEISTPPLDMASIINAKDSISVEERFNDAHQGIMGMLMSAYKVQKHDNGVDVGSLPLTIIGGFLGSGKTTLLNKLLTASHGKRLVVLVNDFGKINIDAELISSQTDDMINLSNGCACCSVSADLTDSLVQLSEREELPDAIVLEASGVADPNGIVQVAHAVPAIRLDGGIAVIDAETMFLLAKDTLTSRLFHNQILASDLIVLTKVDLIDGQQLATARAWLEDTYPSKKIIESINGNVPAEVILGIEASISSEEEQAVSTDHKHDFTSFSFTIEESLNKAKFDKFLNSLPDSILRVKGVIDITDQPTNKVVYQRVGKRDSYAVSEPWGTEKRHTSLVFIGPKGSLDKDALEAGLMACL